MAGQLIDKKQGELKSSWDRYAVTFDHYQLYLNQKEERGLSRYDLDFTDLLYASNYKGGFGSIQEPIETLNDKLNHYQTLLWEAHSRFEKSGKRLGQLDEVDLNDLIRLVERMIKLCEELHIKGLGVPYCSALFHLQLPHLIPVIDRNVLIGLGIIQPEQLLKGQVFHIHDHYTELIIRLNQNIKAGISLRETDEYWFKEGQKKIKSFLSNNQQTP